MLVAVGLNNGVEVVGTEDFLLGCDVGCDDGSLLGSLLGWLLGKVVG